MICPHCKKQMNAWHEPEQGTSFWCTSVKEDGKQCDYSFFKEEECKKEFWKSNG